MSTTSPLSSSVFPEPCFLGMRLLTLLLVVSTVASCGEKEAARETTWTLGPVVVWASEETDATHLPDGVPVRRGLPDTPRAIAWGVDGDLWVTFQDALCRIPQAVTATEIDLLDLPRDEYGGALEPSQALAPGGPGGRIAVGLWNGMVAVSVPGQPPIWRVLPVRKEPYDAGIMPLVRWTSSGGLAIHVHLTCDVAVLDPVKGADVWRRTDGAARYPAASANGEYLLLPWEAGVAAEVLDATTGKSLASLATAGRSRVYGAIDDGGRWAVMGRYDDALTIWDVTSGRRSEVRMEGDRAVPVGLAFLPGTTTCVVAGPTSVRLLDAPTRQWLTKYTLPGGSEILTFLPQGDLTVSPNGKYIAVRASGPTIRILAVGGALD